MSTQLIPVFAGEINHQSTQLVDANVLHAFLEVKRDFSTWIKNRIEKYKFQQNQDFILIHQNGGIKKGRGGDKRSIGYHVSLDMGKELSMVENNEKGREARRYFIGCEKKLTDHQHNINLPPVTTSKQHALQAENNSLIREMNSMLKQQLQQLKTQPQQAQPLQAPKTRDEIREKLKAVAANKQKQQQMQINQFIKEVERVLERSPNLNKTELLKQCGHKKDDKTARNWLDLYEGIHWYSIKQGGVFTYNLMGAVQ